MDEEIILLEGWVGNLYGIPVESTIEAIRLSGSFKGMIIDAVCEGKSMAGLIDLVSFNCAHFVPTDPRGIATLDVISAELASDSRRLVVVFDL